MSLKFTRSYRPRALVALLTVLAMASCLPAFAAPSTPTTGTPTPGPASAESTASPIPDPDDAADRAFRAELARKQAELDELEAQLDELDRELAIASEAYNRAVADLESTRTRLDVTKTDLSNAEFAFAIQKDTLADRARDIYRDGEFDTLSVLLGSKSVSDFIARVRFLRAIGESDAQIAATLEAQRDQIAAVARDLENAELKARSLEFEAEARKIEVMIRIQEREALLASVQTELLELLDQRVGERQAQEAALLRAALTGANRAGIVVEPGSPVETALGYHGIPYLWGGESVAGFDCSGLVLYVFRQHGVNLPHYSGAQFQLGEKVAPADLQPGDAVFFGSPVYHVGIYVGAGYFIHAPRTGDFVKLSRLADRRDYSGARRYAWSYRESRILNAVTDPATVIN
jgi:cell wall-associated NlpC family hydrolase